MLSVQGVRPKGDTEGQSRWQKGNLKNGNACRCRRRALIPRMRCWVQGNGAQWGREASVLFVDLTLWPRILTDEKTETMGISVKDLLNISGHLSLSLSHAHPPSCTCMYKEVCAFVLIKELEHEGHPGTSPRARLFLPAVQFLAVKSKVSLEME